ncbi:MAG: hypothetical protein EOM73_03850 [Bacteroidia bacterium]|nr:hypothetical protein [Bacteroidia bacterium]
MSYLIKRAPGAVALDAPWEGSVWDNAVPLKLEIAFERSTDHRPDTRVKMLYDDNYIYGLFQVKDQYVKAVATENQQQVCLDSCVEFFVKPAGAERYFNFEMNCGGIILLYHVKDCRSGDYVPVPEEDLKTIRLFHTLPSLITEEITEPVTWRLGFAIPIAFFEKYSKINPKLSGQKWTANFTKCADKTSHPHWLSWQNLPKLKPNTRYRITFYVKLENVKPYGASGGVISTCFDQVNRWYPAGPLTGTMPWTKQCNEIVTGPETNRKYPSYFNVTLRGASGKAWVDNIRIYEIESKERNAR